MSLFGLSMPLVKYTFKPGVNRENTRYTTEGGWYECDKIRFRQGSPEKIGGWNRISAATYLGVCRWLWNWIAGTSVNLMAVGTNLKFYLERGGAYSDITPIRRTATLNNPFALTASPVVTVTDTAHGCLTGDFVTFSGATDIGGGGTNVTAAVLNQEFQVTVVSVNSYTITLSVTPNATAIAGSPGGGASVSAAYQINTGAATVVPAEGWGAGAWSNGTWGNTSGTTTIRLWSAYNFGEDLIFGPRGGSIYYWDATLGINSRGVNLTVSGDADTPVAQNYLIVSDVSRFVLAFGANDYGGTEPDPMLIRWSAQEDPFTWTPSITNQAGRLRLSRGSKILSVVQARQELVVFTDSSLYSLQYQGPPFVWGAQLLGDNLSLVGQNATAIASGVVYWMGLDKFYAYDGRVQTLNCDVRRFVFNNFNLEQAAQVFAGVNEAFNEVWWFYCSANSTTVDRYVIYNYLENTWYYGTMARTAWSGTGLRPTPIAATYSNNLVAQEDGLNDNETGTPAAIHAYISTSEFDLGDGHQNGYVWRMLPDLTFDGSSSSPTPEVKMTLYGLTNSGSGVTSEAERAVLKGATYVITEEFTGQIYPRVRGRQMIMKVESDKLGTQWQLGAPRLDIRPDGRR
jgi:hypothetical protein